jgi:hypothetical protein
MEGLTAVEVVKALDQSKRFLVCLRQIYSDLSDASFVEAGKAIWRDSQGRWHAKNATDTNKRIADDARKRAAAGAPESWLSSAQVVEYMPSRHEWKVIYKGEPVSQATVEPEVPPAFLSTDGTFRIPPSAGFNHGREWSLSIAHVDRNTNQPFADRFIGKTKLEVLEKLFSSPIPWVQDLVKTYPLANPEDVPQPVEPVAERSLTPAEIAAIQPFDWGEYVNMPADVYKKRYVLDPRFRVASDKMFEVRKGFEDRMRAKQEAEAAQQELEAEKKKYLQADANERLKSGGV